MQRCLSEELGSPEGAGLLCNAEKHKEFSPAVGLLLKVGWPCCLGGVLVVFGLSPSEPQAADTLCWLVGCVVLSQKRVFRHVGYVPAPLS